MSETVHLRVSSDDVLDMVEALEGLLREFVDSTVPLDAQFSSAVVIKEVEFSRALLARIKRASNN